MCKKAKMGVICSDSHTNTRNVRKHWIKKMMQKYLNLSRDKESNGTQFW